MSTTPSLLLAAVCCLAAAAHALPLAQPHNNNAWQMSGKFEGDILRTPAQLEKNGMTNSWYYWPNRELFYEIKNEFSANDRAVIEGAIAEYNTRTCVRLSPRGNQPDYVSIGSTQNGCYSYVGKIGGAQELNLGNGCVWHGTAVHELLHALGFWHMQSTWNRDDFVAIQWGNIQAGQEHNFDKYSQADVTDFGVSYDYGSVMHYDRYAFSSNGQPTIVPYDPNANIGQNDGLSGSDIAKLHAMYGC